MRSFVRKLLAAGAALPPFDNTFTYGTLCDSRAGDDTPELQELYEALERSRVAGIETSLKRYRSMTPLLIKIEESVAGPQADGLGHAIVIG